MSNDDDFKNALPREVDDHPDSGMPRQLRTQADDDAPLDARQAEVAGISGGGLGTYGDDSTSPNRDDVRDVEGTQERP